jgi:Acetyltransferase (GNAT) domain
VRLYCLDPLKDDRWPQLLKERPEASVFHTVGWLSALKNSYGYEPVAYTTSAPGAPLENAIVFCRFSSWISGKRMVSLPFSDHCASLGNDNVTVSGMLSEILVLPESGQYKYFEMRPLDPFTQRQFSPSEEFYFHEIDLRPGASVLFAKLHKDCIQRKIRRAERERVSYQRGNTTELIREFYSLHKQNRRRLGVLPQPFIWFESLVRELKDSIEVRVAYLNGQPIASIVLLKFKETMMYKYGASDTAHNSAGAMPSLLWNAIEDGCRSGCTTFDMGRSDFGQHGLIEFKDRWGTQKTVVRYYRTTSHSAKDLATWNFGKLFFSTIPPSISPLLARLLYRHVG